MPSPVPGAYAPVAAWRIMRPTGRGVLCGCRRRMLAGCLKAGYRPGVVTR
jgi:hypothetical protein